MGVRNGGIYFPRRNFTSHYPILSKILKLFQMNYRRTFSFISNTTHSFMIHLVAFINPLNRSNFFYQIFNKPACPSTTSSNVTGIWMKPITQAPQHGLENLSSVLEHKISRRFNVLYTKGRTEWPSSHFHMTNAAHRTVFRSHSKRSRHWHLILYLN